MSRRNKKLPDPVEVVIEDLSHDGRGVTHVDGKAVFVFGALKSEKVRIRYTRRTRHFDEALAEEIIEASGERVNPHCPHFGLCGGCVLQHLDEGRQISAKEQVLIENFRRIGGVEPERYFPPLTGPAWHYRRKARLSVRYVRGKERVLAGFRERDGRFVADMQECHILDERISDLRPLIEVLNSLHAKKEIAQVEVAGADGVMALVFRNLRDLPETDIEALTQFCERHGYAFYLQPAGPDSVFPVSPKTVELSYTEPRENIKYVFEPYDFIQVNSEINSSMIQRALDLLDLEPDHKVLDLFCGLGNFSLPIAKYCSRVTGVEGAESLVQRARNNAKNNGIANAIFFSADLSKDVSAMAWAKEEYDRILVDPPRSGAKEILPLLAGFGAEKIVYVSCHPGSLARDAGELAGLGYRLEAAGVMDMFPHTAHVESIALFCKVAR